MSFVSMCDDLPNVPNNDNDCRNQRKYHEPIKANADSLDDVDSSQQIQWDISKIFLVHCERMGYNRFRDRGASGEPAPHSVSP